MVEHYKQQGFRLLYLCPCCFVEDIIGCLVGLGCVSGCTPCHLTLRVS